MRFESNTVLDSLSPTQGSKATASVAATRAGKPPLSFEKSDKATGRGVRERLKLQVLLPAILLPASEKAGVQYFQCLPQSKVFDNCAHFACNFKSKPRAMSQDNRRQAALKGGRGNKPAQEMIAALRHDGLSSPQIRERVGSQFSKSRLSQLLFLTRPPLAAPERLARLPPSPEPFTQPTPSSSAKRVKVAAAQAAPQAPLQAAQTASAGGPSFVHQAPVVPAHFRWHEALGASKPKHKQARPRLRCGVKEERPRRRSRRSGLLPGRPARRAGELGACWLEPKSERRLLVPSWQHAASLCGRPASPEGLRPSLGLGFV